MIGKGYDKEAIWRKDWNDPATWRPSPKVPPSGRGPTAEEMEELLQIFKQLSQEKEPNYPPYFMSPALELAYKTMTPDEKKEVMKIAREECGTFYHPEHALQVVPIFQKHIQAVLEKSKADSEGGQ